MTTKRWKILFSILWATVVTAWVVLLLRSLDPFPIWQVDLDFEHGPHTWTSGYVKSVKPDGVAERAGLQVGDVLQLATFKSWDAWYFKQNKPLVLDVVRDGVPVRVVIEPEKKSIELRRQISKIVSYITSFLCLICSLLIGLYRPKNHSFKWLSLSFTFYAAGNLIDIPAVGSDALQTYVYLLSHNLAFLTFIGFWLNLFAESGVRRDGFWKVFFRFFVFFIFISLLYETLLVIVPVFFLPDNYDGFLPILDDPNHFPQYSYIGFYTHQIVVNSALVACVILPLRLARLVSNATSNKIYWTALTLMSFYFLAAIQVFIYTADRALSLILEIPRLDFLYDLYRILSTVLMPVAPLSVIAFIYVLVAKRLVSFSFFVNKAFAYGLTGLLLIGGYFLFSNQFGPVSQAQTDFGKVALFAGVVWLSFLAIYAKELAEVAIRKVVFVDVDRREERLREYVESMGSNASGLLRQRFCEALGDFCHGTRVVLVERRDQVWVNELRGAVVVEGEVLGDQLVKRRGTLMADDLVATKGFRVIVPGFHRGELSCYLGVQESEDLPELRPDELRMIEFAVQQLVLELKNRELESAHALITSSVDYAVRIQAAYLPQDEVVHRKLGSVDVWWEPRDKIGGDIWWVSPEAADGSCTVVLADCTGHGVPGAMLSVTVVNLLDQIVRDKPGLGPGQLLGQLDERLREALNQNKSDGASDDGCDAVAVRLERGCNRVKFAGAKLSLVHVRGDGVVERIAGDGVSLGYRKRELEAKGLSEHEVILEAQSTLVLYSDGLTDQIGGENARGVSFGHRRIAEAIGGKIGAQQVVKRVRTAFEQWQGTRPRRDDVALIAISPGQVT